MLTTPLLKVPLLAAHAVYTYRGMTPPRRPPLPDEQKRFAIPDYMTRTTTLQMAVTAVAKWALCGVAIAEAAVILALYAPSPASTRVLDILLPNTPATHAASIGLTSMSAAACLLGITGGAVRVWCHRTLGKFFTWQMAVQSDHQLVTTGPYAIVRHPSYTGWVLMFAGNFALLLSKGSYFVEAGCWRTRTGQVVASAILAYLASVTVSLLSRMAKEDAVLRREFGSQWEEWAKRTPYRLIPYVY
ncbi:hypothetical protein BN946_scf185002.g7 [Trametes cinnabarina]|uniref:Protein-S-isoprenylcysteine O-methyltransferase n=1 Tax=Pycnoporus cinnabarinus TaxID=5643 RepID=A0A060SED4_PYCCI|nr:hypothetical protein BN946_scf185002.g7 [Trametes cinnabarina]